MSFLKNCLPLILLFFFACNSGSKVSDPDEEEPQPTQQEITFTIDRNITYQTIEGFGFFGARDVWWTGDEENLITEEWARMIIEDLGITIWRNEYYPPEVPGSTQDANWQKQKPVVEGIAAAAANAGVDLKMIFTVWSPPASMKIAYTDPENWTDRERLPEEPHPGGTKEGGTLDPAKYEEFGNWLADGIQIYEDLGIELYAISPQNEPFFEQFFNSCFYKPEWYAEMLENAIPVVKERYPNVKIFGAEGMVSMEAQPWFHHTELMEAGNESARNQLDIWAVHGYSDGVNPTGAAEDWSINYEEYVQPTGKPIWMTETSGYFDHWESSGGSAGAMDLALNIHAALKYGHVSAWVWWQGSEIGDINEYNLMDGEGNPSKRYYVSKQFYRFIRPGAERIELTYPDSDNVVGTAYYHPEMDVFTVVAINNSGDEVKLTLEGENLPERFDVYTTTKTQNSVLESDVDSSDIVLSPSSIVTLVNGNVFEHK